MPTGTVRDLSEPVPAKRFMVFWEPRYWWLVAQDGEVRLNVHWAYVVTTFGLALFQKEKVFRCAGSVALLVATIGTMMAPSHVRNER